MGIFSLENGKLCRKYRNIELLSNQQDYEVMVMKDEIKLFENENIIIWTMNIQFKQLKAMYPQWNY